LSLTDKEKEEYEQIGIKTIRIGIGNLDYMYNYCKVNDGRPKPAIKAKFKKPLGTDFRWGEILSLQQYQEHICTDCQVIDYYFLRSEQSLKQLQSLNKIFSSSVFNFKIASNTEIVSLLEGDFEDIKSLNPIGLISKYDYPITGRDKTSSISYPSYNYYKYAIKSSHNKENWIWFSNGKCVVPHLIKNMLAKYNDDLVPYILNITLTIPKDDIVKYNNFTITHKEVK
jgi:hypothetical protein